MSTGAPRHHPLDGSRLPGLHQNSGWPSFNRAPGPVKGPPQLVWLVLPSLPVTSAAALGGGPAGAEGRLAARQADAGGNTSSTRPGRQGHIRHPGEDRPVAMVTPDKPWAPSLHKRPTIE